MAPTTPRLRILSVGGNAVSAFLSWRLQATNACDVTLVWKSGYESVSQYGITFKSTLFGNERFKPYAVTRTPEDAAQLSQAPFDYVLLCVKALPDVYDLATIIESVVSPQHTCILINTTHSLGIETYLEQRFPTNVVLSLVSGAELVQLGPSEFEHRAATDIWVGPANKNPAIPTSIQSDMAEALAMTLSSGQVDCKVSENIRQQQYERMIGPIAFHPTSVLFETPNHAELLDKTGARIMLFGLLDELISLAHAQGCTFPPGFRDRTIEEMIRPSDTPSIMYQDFTAKRPMEIETYLGSPLKLAQQAHITVPRLETLYPILHNLNIVNQQRPAAGPTSPTAVQPPPRMSSAAVARSEAMNGNGNGPMMNGKRPGASRAPSVTGAPPSMRRGPSAINGYPPRGASNAYGANMGRRGSMEANDLEEFSHVMLYDSAPDGGFDSSSGPYGEGMGHAASSQSDLAIRERELQLRQRELALREREYNMRRGGRGPPPPASHAGGFDDDEDDDYFDPMATRMNHPPIDTDNLDMMSVTSRRNRRAGGRPSMDAGMGGMPPPSRGRAGMFSRNKNRSSTRVMDQLPMAGNMDIMRDPLMGYSSDRYGGVDRSALGRESRTNSLTAERLNEFQRGGGLEGLGGGAYPSMSRRTSHSPGNPLGPGSRPPGQRPSPPNGYGPGPGPGPHMNGMNGVNGVNGMNGMNGMNGQRPSPPNGMRQPVPRHPPGHGNAVAPQQVEQHAGVSSLYPPKKHPQVRSLTGSASASAGSGDSGASAHLDSEPSAHSSASSLGPRHPVGIRA